MTEQAATDELHRDLVVVDGLEYYEWEDEHFELLRTGGVTCINATVAVWQNARETLNQLADWHRRIRTSSDRLLLALNSADVERAKETGRIAILLGFQNTDPLENDIDLVQVFYQLGIRIIQLTYNVQNSVGGGCWDEPDGGLSRNVGRTWVREMNDVGVLIDLSHSGDRTVLDTIAASERPVAITHGNPASFVGDAVELPRRNRSDDVLRELAAAGGVVGLSSYPKIAPDGARCTLERFCEMVQYTVDMIGIDHVGIGSDFYTGHDETILHLRTGKWSRRSAIELSTERITQDWFENPADFPTLTAGLLEHGFEPEDVRKIMGGNFMRVFRDTLDHAQRVDGATSTTA